MVITHILAPIKLGGGETLLTTLLSEKTYIKENIILLNKSPEMEEVLDKNGIEYFNLSSTIPSQYSTRSKTLIKTIAKLPFIFRLILILRKSKTNIVHLHGFPALILSLIPIKLLSLRSVYTHHFYREKPEKLEEQILTFFYNQIDHITCVSKTVENSFVRSFPKLTTKVTTVYNCIANHFFKDNVQRDRRSDNQLYSFIHIARFAPFKNQLLVLQSISKLPATIKKSFFLIFAGEGETLTKCKKFAQENDINAKFLGHVKNKNLIKYIDECNFSLFPSDLEGFGIGAVECMARGLPVLALNNELMREVVGPHGVLSEKENLDEGFLSITNKKFEDQEIKDYAQNFSSKKIKENYVQLYNQLS